MLVNHGLAEDCGYWRDTGVTAKLAERYRVISMDMRGHGQTIITEEPWGYDADTMADPGDTMPTPWPTTLTGWRITLALINSTCSVMLPAGWSPLVTA
ncbi:MAG: alpha/beta fold hydrolase [Deltaproteobacteria bacterium]|nr:alpha/beta fold hydrolase [Deltaproteobacteria bacterium]